MEKVKTVAYLRYGNSSTENIVELIERDKKIYAGICENNDMELVDVYFDQACGREKDRAGFLQMMDDSTTGKFQRVIVKNLSKLSRDTMEAVNIIRQLKENGASVWLEQEGGLLDKEMMKAIIAMAEQSLKMFKDVPKFLPRVEKDESELDEMLAYLDKLNHKAYEGDEGVYDTEVEIRVGEKSVKTTLDDEVFGVIYDIILSMRG